MRTVRIVKNNYLHHCNVYINHDPVMTLTKFMARSTWVAYAFEWGKLLKLLQCTCVYINHDPVMNLTKFMARSTWVAYTFEWGKLLKLHLKRKASRKLAKGQNIDYSEKRKWPKGFICHCTGVKYHNIQTGLLVYAADLK